MYLIGNDLSLCGAVLTYLNWKTTRTHEIDSVINYARGTGRIYATNSVINYARSTFFIENVGAESLRAFRKYTLDQTLMVPLTSYLFFSFYDFE